MSIYKARDGAQHFYKDWGAGRPIVFSPGMYTVNPTQINEDLRAFVER